MYADVEKATVFFPQTGGQGVLIEDGLIVTAAHCVNAQFDGAMAVGPESFIEKIKTGEETLKVAPLAVEPVSDIAVLGAMDEQMFPDEVEAYEKFCTRTKPVRICRCDTELFQKFTVHLYYRRKKTWVEGTAMQCAPQAHVLGIEAGKEIEFGMSGGPIVSDSGELVGIVSYFNSDPDPEKPTSGLSPRPHLALPVWVCRRIFGDLERG